MQEGQSPWNLHGHLLTSGSLEGGSNTEAPKWRMISAHSNRWEMTADEFVQSFIYFFFFSTGFDLKCLWGSPKQSTLSSSTHHTHASA